MKREIFSKSSCAKVFARLACGFGKMLETLSILLKNQGRSQATPLAAGV